MGGGLSECARLPEAAERNHAQVEAAARFKLGRRLTPNGWNEVREAEDLATGRCCVVKRVCRLSREADMLAQLQHPNVITLYDVIHEQENDLLVMEWANCGSLFDYMSDQEHASEADAAHFIKQALTGLQHCHEAGFVHRGIKPEHCLLSKSGEDKLVLKLTGFENATNIPIGKHFLTELCGTPGYIAPEIIGRQYAKPSDVWSLGAVAYVLLSGRPPFYGDNDAEILRQTRLARLRFDSPQWGVVSATARDFISCAVVVDPALRWTAAQLMHHEWLQP